MQGLHGSLSQEQHNTQCVYNALCGCVLRQSRRRWFWVCVACRFLVMRPGGRPASGLFKCLQGHHQEAVWTTFKEDEEPAFEWRNLPGVCLGFVLVGSAC